MNPITSRLDWEALWNRYDAQVSEIRKTTDAYYYTYRIGSQARELLREIIEEFVASREGALS